MLKEIQNAAVSRDSSITDLLRRCKILSVRLGSREFQEWVDLELNGYPKATDVPPYRITGGYGKGHFVGGFGRQLTRAPIPLRTIPERLRDRLKTVHLREPIGSYEDLLSSENAEGAFQTPWNADLVAAVGRNIYEGMNCLEAWHEIPRGALISLIDAVRNRVLGFALELEQLDPQAGSDAMHAELTPETVSQVFHTHIYGNVGNIASGSQHVSQSNIVAQGDIKELENQLSTLGFTDADIGALKTAIEKDDKKSPGIGKAVSQWLGKAIGKAGEGLLKVTTETAIQVVPALIRAYLGLPPTAG